MTTLILDRNAQSSVYFYTDKRGFVEDPSDHCQHRKFSVTIQGLNSPYEKVAEVAMDLAKAYFPNMQALPVDIGFAQGEMIFSSEDIMPETKIERVTLFWEGQSQPPEFSDMDKSNTQSAAQVISEKLRSIH